MNNGNVAGMPDVTGALLQVDILDFCDSIWANTVNLGFPHFVDEKAEVSRKEGLCEQFELGTMLQASICLKVL